MPAARRALILVLLLAVPLGEAGHGAAPTCPDRAPWRTEVTTNADLAAAAAACGWTGSGTAGDPYVVQGYALDGRNVAAGEPVLRLVGTTAHVVLRNLTITRGGADNDAVEIRGASNVTIRDSTFESNRAGVVLNATRDVTVANVVFRASAAGVRLLDGATRTTLVGNRLEHNARAFELAASTGNSFDANVVSIASGQMAFHFASPAAFRNAVPPTNTVNGVAVRWYVGLAGSPGAPVVVRDLAVAVPGITNVAQILVAHSANVLLESVAARDGAADGLLLWHANATEVRSLAADGNAGAGLRIVGSGGASGGNVVAGAALARNGAALVVASSPSLSATGVNASSNREGVRLVSSPSATFTGAVVRANGGHGLHATSSPGLRWSGGTVELSTGDGLRLEAPGAGSRVESVTIANNTGSGLVLLGGSATIASNVVSANGGDGLRVEGATADARSNVVRGHARNVVLNGSREGIYASNDVTVASTGEYGFYFVDAASWDNSIDATNRVNGVPLRWYARLLGTAGAPVRIGDFSATVPNATNVAQVFLYEPRDVLLENVVAANGTRGVYVYGGIAVELRDVDASRNAVGVVLEGTRDSRLTRVAARSTGTGVELRTSTNNVLAAVDATGAASPVVVGDDGSVDNKISGTVATGARGASVVTDPTLAPPAGKNVVVDAGLDKVAPRNGSATFADAVAATRFPAERIVRQSWDFGDGETATSADAAPFRPSHAYASLGNFTARYAVDTLDGARYEDSVRVTVVEPLSAPRGFRGVAGNGTVFLRWLPPLHDGGAPIQHYLVFRDAGAGLEQLTGIGAPGYEDRTVENGGTYLYEVVAVAGGVRGPPTPRLEAKPAAQASPPRSLAAAVGEGRITLSWSEPTSTGGLPLLGYVVRKGAEDGPVAEVARPTNATWTDTNVTAGTFVQYVVAALTGAGEGAAATRLVNTTPDHEGPTFGDRVPADGATTEDTEPQIRILYSDPGGLDLSTVRIRVNGLEATMDAEISPGGLAYSTKRAFPAGYVTVTVSVSDLAGNAAETTWTFTVLGPGGAPADGKKEEAAPEDSGGFLGLPGPGALAGALAALAAAGFARRRAR